MEFQVQVDDETLKEIKWAPQNLELATFAARLSEMNCLGKTLKIQPNQGPKWVSLGACAQINRESLVESSDVLGCQVVGCFDKFSAKPELFVQRYP